MTKYHRTISSYCNTLLDAGFALQRLAEPEPAPDLAHRPDYRDELRRPMFLIISAIAI